VALLRGLPVAGIHRGGDPGPGRAAVPGCLDQGQLAALELGRQAAGSSQRGERGRVVQAAAARCGGQPGQRLRDAGEPVITYTEPGVQGDRSTGGTKPATLETGATVQVPLFITQGEKVKVDTRDSSYLGRVKS